MRRERWTIWIFLALLWACALLPWLSWRAFIWEEGNNAGLARNILEHGNLLRPVLFGVSWSEKPSLLPWLIAGLSKLAGGVTEVTARLPAILSVLATALMVQALTRRYASVRASIFAAATFMFCPLLLQKLTIAEPDTLITALSFGAFMLWWNATELGAPSWRRWIGCGALLVVLAMAKGPQPVGFFALGVGIYLLLTGRWRDVPGLFVCLLMPLAATLAWAVNGYTPGEEREWLRYMRLQRLPATIAGYVTHNAHTVGQLLLEMFPAWLVLPFLPAPWRRAGVADAPAVILPLLCYATACTAVLLVWPFALSRYAMPIAPAIAVLGGIAWDRIPLPQFKWLRDVATGAAVVLAIYQLALVNVLIPMVPDRFANSRNNGERIAATIASAPAPVYCERPFDGNQMFYTRLKMACLDDDDVLKITAPAWLIAWEEDLDVLAKKRPDLEIRRMLVTRASYEIVTAYLAPRAAAPVPRP
jgi:4-amino-4-deoxy-L-arabinose transferase-like glycosyltransferase